MYEPKIEVVREDRVAGTPLSWWPEDGQGPYLERAYLVRGLPMPGEKVVSGGGHVYRVKGLVSDGYGDMRIEDENGDPLGLHNLRPYDPEAERLRVATEAVKTRAGQWWVLTTTEAEVIARAVLDALKEVDDD